MLGKTCGVSIGNIQSTVISPQISVHRSYWYFKLGILRRRTFQRYEEVRM